jgi:ABC-type lipoprotein export system ATPase subunit
MGNFVLIERQSKAKHLQTIAGVKPSTYWLSTFLWDTMNYQIPLGLTLVLMLAFDVDVFTTTERQTFGGVIALLFLFGPASASFAYCISFFFSSASLCNIFIIMIGFLSGLAAPITTYTLRLIGSDSEDPWEKLLFIAKVIEWVGRFIPHFCLGKGLFYTINIQVFDVRVGGISSVWSTHILLFEVISLGIQIILYLALATRLDGLSSDPELTIFWRKFTAFFTCNARNSYEMCEVEDYEVDSDVLEEEERVMSEEASGDAVSIRQLKKVYGNGKVAVRDLSLGIPPGECFGLLGTNGAGYVLGHWLFAHNKTFPVLCTPHTLASRVLLQRKTTTMSILCAEIPPTSGDALISGSSVVKDTEIRQRIAYCPQYVDAHFENMTGREHVELYASLKGIEKAHVKQAAENKLAEVGLSVRDRDRFVSHYSGGMKRKLSLACATMGQPKVVCKLTKPPY